MHQRLQRLKLALKVEWGELAGHLGMSRAMLDFVRKGQRNLSIKASRRLEEVERAAGLSPPQVPPVASDTLGEGDRSLYSTTSKKVKISSLAPGRTCRVYGFAQCAARGFRIGDVVPDREEDLEQVPVPAALARIKRVAAFRAVDDSMEPLIHDGDILFLNPDEELRDGDIALVKFKDQVACKRVAIDRERERLLLMSYASGIRTIVVPKHDLQWAYRAIGALSIRVW